MQIDPITIRRATVADAKVVSDLVVCVLHTSSMPDYGAENIARVASHFTPDAVADAARRNHMILAERAGRICGTASLGGTAADPNTQALRTFFVSPQDQGYGIGSKLLDVLEAEARRMGLTKLPVRSSIGGMPFYRARGFDTLTEVWEADELTYQMSKPLT